MFGPDEEDELELQPKTIQSVRATVAEMPSALPPEV